MQAGCRNYCGHALPDGLTKNTKIEGGPIMTPTTKGIKDRPISVAEIIEEKLMTKEDLEVCEVSLCRVK